MSGRPVRKKSKNPSYFSHEFVITNHGDIVSFVAMIIVMGLLYKGTHSIASNFVFIQHNVTDEGNTEGVPLYRPGKGDICVIFFYTLITIVLHAVLQEYLFDRIVKKLDLTKIRLGKFNESAHHAFFYMISLFWAIYNVVNENLIPNLSSLWQGYPHLLLPFWTKLFLIIQICYWLHDYPELYFQRVKKDLFPARILQATIFVIGISMAYIGGLSKLCMVLLIIHYGTDVFFHVARTLHFTNYCKAASVFFTVWNILFIPVRMACIILPFLVLHYGLGQDEKNSMEIALWNFNSPVIRLSALLFLFISQAYMVWNFITFHQRFRRDKHQSPIRFPWFGHTRETVAAKRKERKKVKREDDDASDTPVENSDSNNPKETRRRKVNKIRQS